MEAKLAKYEFQSTKKGVKPFSGVVRTFDIECRLTGVSIYLTLSDITLFVAAYIPLMKDESTRLI